jgi:hypothetical protein
MFIQGIARLASLALPEGYWDGVPVCPCPFNASVYSEVMFLSSSYEMKIHNLFSGEWVPEQ